MIFVVNYSLCLVNFNKGNIGINIFFDRKYLYYFHLGLNIFGILFSLTILFSVLIFLIFHILAFFSKCKEDIKSKINLSLKSTSSLEENENNYIRIVNN